MRLRILAGCRASGLVASSTTFYVSQGFALKFGIRYLLVATAITAVGAAVLSVFGLSIFLFFAVLLWPVVIGFIVEASTMDAGRKIRTIFISSFVVLLFASLHLATTLDELFAILIILFWLLVICAAWAPQFLLIAMLHDTTESSERSD